jgi:hypothetical protein
MALLPGCWLGLSCCSTARLLCTDGVLAGGDIQLYFYP